MEIILENSTNSPIPIVSAPVSPNPWPLFVALISISSVCLFLTSFLYLLTREKQNFQGWTQFSYLVALLLFNIVFIPALCPGLTDGDERNATCFTLSALNQYFFVCSKTWLIVISIDMYSMIRKPKMVTHNSKEKLSRFVIYSMIGWVLPAVFTASGVFINWKNRKKLPVSVDFNDLWTTVPDYGFRHCRIPNWFVWECFVFGNCLFHFFMFILLTFTIFRQKCFESFNSAESRTTRKKQSPFVLLLRLFVVVGLSWSYIAIQDLLSAGNINTKQTWFWHIFRCIFFLQGVFISVIIVSNGRTMSNLVQKYTYLKRFTILWKFPKIQWNIKAILALTKCATPADVASDNSERKESIQSNVSLQTVDTIIME